MLDYGSMKIDSKMTDWLIRDKYSGDKTADLSKDLERIRQGEPMDYVIGWSDFCGCRIGLDSRPLIPRSETEFWTSKAIEAIKKSKKESPRCLDIFSGSGCVGIAILKHIPNAHVVFAEKSTKFCRQIKQNLEQNGIAEERYKIIRANVFRPFEAENFSEKFDYILANPPYIPEERKDKLDKSVTDWEPQEALFAKDDGLLIIKRFLSEVKDHLNLGGQVWLEFDISQNLTIKELAEGKFSNIVFHKDQYSRWRFVTFQI